MFILLLLFNFRATSESATSLETVAFAENNTETAGSALSAQEQLAILNQKAVTLTSQPGWVFIRSTVVYDTDTENNGILPNGQEIPLSQINEDWFHINEDGLVYESVDTMYTTDGEVVQTAVFADNFSWNSATDEKSYQAPYSLDGMSGDLASLMQEMIDRTGQMPDMTVNELDGRKIYTFTISYEPDEPIKGFDFDQAVTEIITVVSIDNDTGLPVQYDQIMVFEDGTERAFYRTSFEIQIGVTPPENIVKLIEERK